MPKAETTKCYTLVFPYQRHFDGYIEMSEDDAALFWEMDPDPAPSHQSDNIDPMLPAGTAPKAESTIPDKVTSIGPVPTSEPEDSRRADASATLVDESRDTKPVEPVCAVHGWDQTGASADNTLAPRPL